MANVTSTYFARRLAILVARALGAAGLAAAAVLATAHDLAPASPNASWAPGRDAFMPGDTLFRAAAQKGVASSLFSVLVLPNKWAQYQTLRVCFVGGSPALRGRILAAAKPWFVHVNLTMDTGGPTGRSCAPVGDDSEFRVGFAEPGYWSYIGNESIDPRLVTKNLVSLNLQDFDRAPPPSPRFEGLVLHEFGHALGFHHEHQSPAGGCDDQFDWPKLYAFYKRVYNWDPGLVNQNVRQLNADRSAYDWSRLDPSSIMLYASDVGFLKDGKRSRCYFRDNDVLSSLDKEGAASAYPRDGSRSALLLQAATLPIALKSDTLGLDLRRAITTQNALVQRQAQRLGIAVGEK